MILNLVVLPNKYAIYKFKKDTLLPNWIYSSDFYSITKTNDELSVVTYQTKLSSENFNVNTDWRIIKIVGLLDFYLIGIIAEISNILKREKISIFTISTYDTDYFLVKQKDLNIALKALRDKGHKISILK